MDKEDARFQKPEQLHERRKQVVRLHRAGHGLMAIMELTGLSYTAVRRAMDLCDSGGFAALKPAKRGRNPGEGRVLSPEQEQAIRRTICEKRPVQLKMEFALRTRAVAMQLIEQQCGIKLCVRAVGNYPARWGFTPQKPIKRAFEQVPEAVRQWLEQEYPAIEKRAHAEGGETHWGDETALVNTDMRGRSYAPRGKTLVTMAVGGTRQKLAMLSTVTNRGRANWMIIDGSFNHERLIEFLRALVQNGKRAGRKVFLILDNLGVHHCKPVKAWIAKHKADIEVFFLPSYSPVLNPDERLNAYLKDVIATKVPVRTKGKLHSASSEHMTFIEAHPERVLSYFQDPLVKYAA